MTYNQSKYDILGIIKCLIIMLLLTLISCSSSIRVESYALMYAQYIGHDKYNVRVYFLKNYNEKISLNENISNQDTIKGVILTINESQWKEIKSIEKLVGKDIILANVIFKLEKSKEYKNSPLRHNLGQFGKVQKPFCIYDVFDDYESLEIIEYYTDGIIIDEDDD